jgi:hypothetical protein
MTVGIRKHVDVFVRDVLVASYPIVLSEGSPVTSDQEFIDVAIAQMRQNGTDEDVAAARFVVRTAPV